VETPTDETEGVQGFPEMVAAENFVIDRDLGDVISQSFGATEQTFPNPEAILNLRSAFRNARQHHVTVLGSSGDEGATDLMSDLSCCYPMRVNSWPSSDPLVTSMGGTQLKLDATGQRLSPDVVWNDGFGASGGGLSTVFKRPQFQDDVKSMVDSHRGTPDISLSSAVDGGVVVYFTFIRPSSPWHIFGGTSEASPLFAGIVAIADQAAHHRLGWLNPRLYRMRAAAGIVDVTSGNNSFAGVVGFTAGPGYDLASGLGTVDATKLVMALTHDTGHDASDDTSDDRAGD
ncbi:MAG TPA: S53 family peptidase, partial [Chloroflexota bacterium]